MIALYKKRDKKETALGALQEQQNLNKQAVVRIETAFQKKLAQYQQWLKDNEIEGLRYK